MENADIQRSRIREKVFQMISYDAIEFIFKFCPQKFSGLDITSWHEGTFTILGNVYLAKFDLFQISWVVAPVPLCMLLDSNDGTLHTLKRR